MLHYQLKTPLWTFIYLQPFQDQYMQCLSVTIPFADLFITNHSKTILPYHIDFLSQICQQEDLDSPVTISKSCEGNIY